MSFKDLKDKLYYYIVEKNSFIKRDYEGYVNNNLQEHHRNRIKSWLLLIKLNFYYRILRKNEPYFKPVKSKNIKLPYLDGPESEVSKRQPVLLFARELLKYDVVSFDIFDTLILRPFAKPSDLFMIVGNKLGCTQYAKIRIDAEKEARKIAYKKKGSYEVNIFDIYEIVENRTGINKEYGVKVELETEIELCFANPYMERIYKILIGQGKDIIAVSDMYIPQDMMLQILKKCGYKDLQKVYVSCDYNCSKRDGGLYKIVKNDIGNKSLVHIGDNYISDVKSAEDNGIKSNYYKNVNEIGNPFRADGMSDLVGSAYSGIVNAHLHNGIKQYNPYYEYGFIYGGLYVLGFCNWIYKKAKKENVDKIIFLARDGDIYKNVFKLLNKDNIPNEYLFWSRISNIKYTLELNRNEFLTRMVYHKALSVFPVTISDLLKSLSLEKLEENLTEYDLTADTVITKDNVTIIENFFTNNWDMLLSTYEKQNELVYDLLIRSIIGNAKRIAVIDVGWVGSGPLGLKYLIEKKLGLDCKVYCWLAASTSADTKHNINELMNEDIEAYIFSRMKNRNLYDVHTYTNKGTNNIYFELFTQAKYPSFSGINDYGDYTFDIPEVENYYIIDEIHKGIYDFCSKYISLFSKNQYLYNISGYDAYLPYRMIIRNLKFIKKYFSEISFARGICGSVDNQRIETIGDILRNVNI